MLEKIKNFFKKKQFKEFKMLTQEELQNSEINGEIIREALNQCEKNLMIY